MGCAPPPPLVVVAIVNICLSGLIRTGQTLPQGKPAGWCPLTLASRTGNLAFLLL